MSHVAGNSPFKRISKISVVGISLILNAVLAAGLILAIATRKPTPDAAGAYKIAYDQALLHCQKEAPHSGADCTQLHLVKIDYQTVEHLRWFMDFRVDNLSTNVRWEAFVMLDQNNRIIDEDYSTHHCGRIMNGECVSNNR